MNRALEILKERGFVQQCSDLEGLSNLMDEGPITFYIGTDPTGPSLHIGHMVPFFAMRHLRDAGHRGIALLGGGTARIGDPSGKTEMRKLISYEEIDANTERFIDQLDRFIHFDGVNALTANNKDWLSNLNYIEFLRDIGRHFSVNRMLSFESYRMRLETGLSFIEFNYQLLQSYDYLQLYKLHGCRLQIGGDDQWGNIVAGIELIRRVEGAECYGLTFPLVTTSDGKKMGKTEKGALFLDPEITSPYEFFQYFRNVPDSDVERFLLMFTFLPIDECRYLGSLKDKALNEAKERLAWEVTSLIHGEEEANKALSAAKAAFRGEGDASQLPTIEVEISRLDSGIGVLDLFVEAGLAPSKSEARRLVKQSGASVNGRKIENEMQILTSRDLENNALMLRAGKKRVARVVPKS
ncbi:MAG TPA: tyrosine--tRNA ligase [Rectinema sp.]|jgi:tyrosyl-tRNA synthetase|nr:tyrosine--tRNA ligase [Spirochaetia bacterium]HAL93550.1 tyrosine--tRNA ligase [Spirochaetaceae bacterium]HNV18798.1 tyrosine--tRNA ligase [Rectinema sp.]HNY98106.1 tyrosine--tRNA ligase [Rectinema sp.]HOD57584.1 tyrosine--tRNA ligase [Rectinema sp.]